MHIEESDEVEINIMSFEIPIIKFDSCESLAQPQEWGFPPGNIQHDDIQQVLGFFMEET